jgi:threonine/homoserine/homoserine lactone efflux protein
MADPLLLRLREAYLTGWVVAAPIGPVNLEIVRRSLGRRLLDGFMVGLGATCLDACYLLIFTAGFGAALNHLPWLRMALFLAGGALLVALGSLALWEAWGCLQGRDLLAQEVPRARSAQWRESLPGHFGLGFLMCATNPMTLAFWASLSLRFADLPMDQRLMASGMVWLGAFSWILTLTAILAFARRWVGPRLFAAVTVIGGACLIFFGVSFLLQVLPGG